MNDTEAVNTQSHSTGESVIRISSSDLKIKSQKVINVSDLNSVNNEALILHIKCETEDELLTIFKLFKHEKFENLCFIVIESTLIDLDARDKKDGSFKRKEFLRFKLLRNISYEKSVLIQVFPINERVSTFYLKLENSKTLIKEDSPEFPNFGDILNKLSLQRKPLLDINLRDILVDPLSNNELIHIRDAILNKSHEILNILLLFSCKLYQEDLEVLLKKGNEKLLSVYFAHCNVDNLLKHNLSEKFMVAIALNNERVVLRRLLNDAEKFAHHVNYNLWIELKKHSLGILSYESFYELQKIESEYFDVLRTDQEKQLKKIPKVVRDLHENIKIGKLAEIQEIVLAYPEFKFYRGNDGISALERAIEFKKFEIYSFLLSKCFMAIDQEGLNKKISQLSLENKTEIQKYNLNYAESNRCFFINILCNKCKLFKVSEDIGHENIREMLLKLSTNPILFELLKATSELDLNIVFDLTSESVDSISPNVSKNVVGYNLHREFVLLIGKDQGKYERYGTFIHELSHQLLYLLYENDCLPYCRGDIGRKNKFNKVYEIVCNSRNSIGIDSIIALVFQYSVANRLIEMAVRANHIYAKYIEEPEKLNKQQKLFPDLFEFNEEFISDLKIPNVLQLIKLNNDFGLFNLVESSNLKTIEYQSIFVKQELPEHYNVFLTASRHKRIIFNSNVPIMTISHPKK